MLLPRNKFMKVARCLCNWKMLNKSPLRILVNEKFLADFEPSFATTKQEQSIFGSLPHYFAMSYPVCNLYCFSSFPSQVQRWLHRTNLRKLSNYLYSTDQNLHRFIPKFASNFPQLALNSKEIQFEFAHFLRQRSSSRHFLVSLVSALQASKL